MKRLKRVLFVAGLIAFFGLLPMGLGSEYILNITVLFFLYVTVAESWNLLGGFSGQVSLGHSAFFGTGALVTRLLWVGNAPILISLVGGAASAVLLAGIVGVPCLRMRSAYFPIGTLALALIAQITVGNLFPVPGSLSSQYLQGYDLLGRYYLALSVALLTVSTVWLVVRSRMGLALIAIRDDDGAAEAIGVKTFNHKVVALLLSSFLAGLGGGVFAYYQVSYYYSGPFALSWSFLAPLATFIGGLATISGPIVGSFLFLALSEIFAVNLGEMHVLIFGVTFIFVVLFLPGGLLSAKKHLVTLFRRCMPKLSSTPGPNRERKDREIVQEMGEKHLASLERDKGGMP